MSNQVAVEIVSPSQAVVELTGPATPATVEVIGPATPATVELTGPATPATVEVTAPGPQGPVRVGRVLTDATTPGTLYIGTAELGAEEDVESWTITRSQFNAAGIRTSRGTASGVTWTGRATHSYT